MKKLLILFLYALIYSQNFIYDEEDWIVISNPGFITSITVRFDEIMFTSNKGVFIYNDNNDNFSFMPQFIRGFSSNNNKIIHNDGFRDHLWFLNDQKLFFKPYISSIWREIDFYELNIIDSSSIVNIGSNHDFIFLKINGDELIVLDPYSGKKINFDEDFFIDTETIIWSATYYDSSNKFDLQHFKSDAGYNIITNDYIEYNGQFIYINSVIEDNNKNVWIGTNTGQLFKCNLYTDSLEKVSNIPYLSNMRLAHLDEYNEWWMATDDSIVMQDETFMNASDIFLIHWKEINNEWDYVKQNISLNITSSDITSIIRYGANVYVGTNKGLLLYNIKKNTWTSYDEINENYYIYNLEKNEDYLYVATNKGLKIISIINDLVMSFNNLNIFSDQQIYDLLLSKNDLYIASEIGLFNYNIFKNKLNEISKDIFLNITNDKENNLLLLSNKNRVFSYTDNIKYIASIKRIKDICFCNNFLWINNNQYATLFDLKSSEIFEYNYLDGIPGRKINSIQCDNDWVSFATDKGLVLYNWLKYHDYKK